jgi:iron(III) transport system ATP-binding protein
LLRPDDVVAAPDNSLTGTVMHKAFKGADILYTLQMPTGSKILTLFPSHHDHAVGDKVGIALDMHHVVAFPVQE